MKISYKWLLDYLPHSIAPQALDQVLTATGLEVEGITPIENIKGGLKGLVIGKVITCEKHPNADKLHVTTCTTNGENQLHIVCGAPNVAAGQKVIVAPVGTIVHPIEGEPFEIKSAKIRGQISEGMLCAEDEIGLGSAHAGIMVLPETAPVGQLAADYFNLSNDYCIEIGLTPNRTDAISHIGVARDLAAANGVKVKYPEQVFLKPASQANTLNVSITNTNACTRYMGAEISGIVIAPSPEWMQARLKTIGLQPINNIVDITNYVMHELGHPLHAFDINSIQGNTLEVRFASEGENFTTLDHKSIALTPEMLVIADAAGPIALAGVMGGNSTGIQQSTTAIFLECAAFAAPLVRKSAKLTSIKTDSSYRFERGIHPESCTMAMNRVVALILQLVPSAKLAAPIIDHYAEPVALNTVHVLYHNVEKWLGKKIPNTLFVELLQRLEFNIVQEFGDGVTLQVPHYRTDVTREIDVIEEFLRIYGYNNISDTGLIQYAPGEVRSFADVVHHQTEKIGNMLAVMGFKETMNLSLTDAKWAQLLEAPFEPIFLKNPLSAELSLMRFDLIWGGLQTLTYNLNRKMNGLSCYEIGNVYYKVNEKVVEKTVLGLWLTGVKTEQNRFSVAAQYTIWDLLHALNAILERMGLRASLPKNKAHVLLENGFELKVNKKTIGTFGLVSGKLCKAYDLKQQVWYAALDWKLLVEMQQKTTITYQEIPRFPEVKRDLALLVNENTPFEEVIACVPMHQYPLLKDLQLFDFYKGEHLPTGKISLGLRFTFQDPTQTLTDERIEAMMNKFIATFEHKIQATFRA